MGRVCAAAATAAMRVLAAAEHTCCPPLAHNGHAEFLSSLLLLLFFFRSPTLIRIRIIVGIGMFYSRRFITHIIILYTGIQYNTILLL